LRILSFLSYINIFIETQDLLQGLTSGLEEEIAGKDQAESILKSSKICKAPEVLLVRFTRFFWKQKEQIKAKILRKVKFPLQLDISSLSLEEYGLKSYQLRSIITHSGRSADSGHYICWLKDFQSGSWWKMDDEKASPVKEEDILKLDGGGDWHMAYLCLYEVTIN